jgi:deoxyuridine 5'-triphosphate nucleotidohydrolase
MGLRKSLGRALEWLLSYDHEVVVSLGPGAQMPFRKYDGDAGYDLHADREVIIPPGCTADVTSGVRVDMRDRVWLEIKARSSTLKVRGLEVVDAVIDRDYRGEMMAVVHNPTGQYKKVLAGDRLVQVVPHRLVPLSFRAGPLSPSPRGSNGFGSTGER